ncbi:MAG TPA: hypothetical protein PKH72_00085 [Rhodoferax sp.]|jgi:hypothetical protein|nr:hypothetical protein [Rhodoferax sp.]HNV58027.1 hypothetical protein [Rhodoferax sp.]
MFKPISISIPTVEKLGQPQSLVVVNNVFKVFHGDYGNLFLMKFATGQLAGASEVDAVGQSIEGQDKGVLSARQIWAHALRGFDAATVKAALTQCRMRYPDFPPNLPQFLAICAANKPREVFKPEVPAIGMDQTLRSKYAAQAREINARHSQQATHSRLSTPASASGLDALKQAIANAVSNAGGDEVLELMRLDFLLAPQQITPHDRLTSP